MLTGCINKRKVKEGKAHVLVAMVFVSSWTGLRIGSGLIRVLVLMGPCPSQTLVLFCRSARCSSSGCQLLCAVATSHHSGSPEGPSLWKVPWQIPLKVPLQPSLRRGCGFKDCLIPGAVWFGTLLLSDVGLTLPIGCCCHVCLATSADCVFCRRWQSFQLQFLSNPGCFWLDREETGMFLWVTNICGAAHWQNSHQEKLGPV